jgi:hypothetical protein
LYVKTRSIVITGADWQRADELALIAAVCRKVKDTELDEYSRVQLIPILVTALKAATPNELLLPFTFGGNAPC